MSDTASSSSNAPARNSGTANKSIATSSQGSTKIADGVVAKVAGIAASGVSGVYALGGGAARAVGALRNLTGQQSLTQGISVEVGETQAAVDVSVIAEYPTPLQRLSDDLRSSIIDAVESIVGLQVTEVNVSVLDVHVETEDDEDDDQQQSQPSRVQ